MTTTFHTMLGGANASATGMASRSVAAPMPRYVGCAAGAVSPAFAPSTGVAAWRKTTAAGTRTTHHADAVSTAIPDGSGGSG